MEINDFQYSVKLDKYFELNLIDFIKKLVDKNDNNDIILSFDKNKNAIPGYFYDKYFISIEIATNKLDEEFYVCDFGFIRDEFKRILENLNLKLINDSSIYCFIKNNFLEELIKILQAKINDHFFVKISFISLSNNKIFSISKYIIYK